ncbi:MAG: RluA family pseudouridine synthase [Phyllobacteriaceae bacterium]|nr:RluA family pseudouridine synthase [Phyllobacteriaceae bacterium]
MPGADSPEAPARIVLTAGPDAAGRRLDQWLAETLKPDYSRSRLQALARAGALSIDGVVVADPGRKLKGGEALLLALPEAEAAEPAGENLPLTILHEDADLIVIDKPAGLVVHPGAGNPAGTLVNALIHHCGDSLSGIGGVKRPGIVHRLDKDTSGVMVVAKNDRAHRALAEAFADHGRDGVLERAYLALVWGIPDRAEGVIEAPLGRASADRTLRAVVRHTHPDARQAVTHWRRMERFGDAAALVECRLETGRTHQIRVHMAHFGHPLIGDPDYGQGFRTKANRLPEPLRGRVTAFPRQALHARLLAFAHPADGRLMRFETDPPADLADLIAGFRTQCTSA